MKSRAGPRRALHCVGATSPNTTLILHARRSPAPWTRVRVLPEDGIFFFFFKSQVTLMLGAAAFTLL